MKRNGIEVSTTLMVFNCILLAHSTDEAIDEAIARAEQFYGSRDFSLEVRKAVYAGTSASQGKNLYEYFIEAVR